MRALFALFLVCVFSSPLAFAGNNGAESLLNKVKFRLNAEQWVASQTALVTVGLNAGVSDAGMASIQAEVIKKLNQIASQAQWHVVSFTRSLDQSGLEKVQISAQARLPSSALPTLRDKAKALSKPGETFTLDNVQFTPSEDEIRAANIQLRSNLYTQAKEELDRVNKAYPEQKFYIHDVDFMEGMPPGPMPQPMYMTANMRAGGGANEAANIAVGDKITLWATVTLAATPDQALIKLLH